MRLDNYLVLDPDNEEGKKFLVLVDRKSFPRNCNLSGRHKAMSNYMEKPRPRRAMPEIGEPFIPQKLFTEIERFVGPIAPVCLMQYEKLSIYAKHCWYLLAHRAGKDGECFPSYQDLAKGSMSVREAIKAIKELEEKGFIKKFKGGKGKSNHYQLLWHEVFASMPKPGGKITLDSGDSRVGDEDPDYY